MNKYSFTTPDYTFSESGKMSFDRITKAAAQKAIAAGKTIAVAPCKMQPVSMWDGPCFVSLEHLKENYSYMPTAAAKDLFEKFCNAFTYYNCNRETGKYIAFYSVTER